jgi:hypothetical protein
LLAAVVSLTAGCVGLPDEGPVEEAQTSGSGTRADAMAINPLGPQPDQSPSEVVKGFLDAMRATPIRDDIAREFLSERAKSEWNPVETIVYESASLPRPSAQSGDLVDVALTGADRIDDRGSWQGALPGDALRFRVTKEDGQVRIDALPEFLIVPQNWYAQRFRQVSLYFFDPTSQVLVPDPVFVPRASDLASTLVRRLVAGPAPELVDYSRNLLPAGADPGIEVPVSDDGLATVDFEGDVEVPTLADRGLLVAQLAWTLRQDPSVERVRVRIDGTWLTQGGQPEVGVSTGEVFAPFVAEASSLLFGLADGLMVAGSAQTLAQVSGPFGQADLGLRSVTPDLDASEAAGVSGDGGAMYVAPVRDPAAGALDPVVTGASDLLVPAWDFAGRLWMVDRRPDGAVVSYLREGRVAEIDVQGVSGQDVKSFLVSRDGSRLVAVLQGDNEDQIVVSRLLQDADGKVVRALPARQVDVEGGRGLKIRDIAWLSPTSIVVLHPVDAPRLFQVRSTSVDGAPADVDALSVTIDDQVVGLIGSPDPGQSTYAIAARDGQDVLIDLSGTAGGDLDVAPGITSLGYVG